MNRLPACLLALALSVPLMAQQDKEAQKQINAIKRSNSYLYAEATMPDEAEAYEGAKNILRVTVEDWITSNKKGDDTSVYIAKAQNCLQQINTRRGNYYRQFVYVKKSDIMPVAGGEDVMIVGTSDPKTPAETSAAAAEPDAEAGATVAKTEPAAAEAPTPSLENTIQQPTELETRMVAIERAEDIEPFVKGLRAEGKLAGYGRYKDMPRQAECYVFVFNRSHEVVAVIRQTGSGQVNLRTGEKDNVGAYAECGAIWLQMK